MGGLEFLILFIGVLLLTVPIGLIVVWVSISGLKKRILHLEYTADELRSVQRHSSLAILEMQRSSSGAPQPAMVPKAQPGAQTVVFEKTPETQPQAMQETQLPVMQETQPETAAETTAQAREESMAELPSAALLSEAEPLKAAPHALGSADFRVELPTQTPRLSSTAEDVSPGVFPNKAVEEEAHVAQAPSPDFVEKTLRLLKRWFSEGNVPVKIGILVFLAGVAALLKYAIDQEWIVFPMEFRLASIAALSLGGLVFAWKKRESRRVFALSLQGGCMGVLLLTVFAAYKWYGMLPSFLALALSVALIAGVGILAVIQNAKALAVFAIMSGFMAPIWLSTGSDNHVALFSYYALLNAAIFGIAWHRSWRGLNVLGFVFTFGMGWAWGVSGYFPEKFFSTEPFLVLFFLFYLLLPILYARKRAASRKDILDGSLLFGTPLIVFILQAGLLAFEKLPVAFCALALGILYAVLAATFIKRKNFVALGEVYALLAVGFATLAVPLALSAQSTACIFALEGAGLLWLGFRQKRKLPQWTGVGLQLLAGFVVFSGATRGRFSIDESMLFANAAFMSALVVALAGFASAGCCYKAKRRVPAVLFYGWGLAWWCSNALQELGLFIPYLYLADALLVFAILTGWVAAEIYRRRPWVELGLTTLLAWVGVLPLLGWQVAVHAHPFAGHGLWAWGVFAVLGFRSLWCLRDGGGRMAAWTQSLWWVIWMVAISSMLRWLGAHFYLGEGWQIAGVIFPWFLLAAVSMFRWGWLSFPQRASFHKARPVFQTCLFAVLALWWLYALFSRADSAPLPWIPLLNPLELAQIGVFLLAMHGLGQKRISGAPSLYWNVLSIVGFIFISVAVLRMGHHWGGARWDLYALLKDKYTETSLTVVWSILGVLGWIMGSRKRLWKLWLMGALLMGVVLAKLVLIDRANLGDMFGILSFIVYGILCIATGYFAPAPPRRPKEEEERLP
ncbi:MAG: DUF2339 domain-containing protein [Cystobacterineae bacterium]|nr:DUF2339 domain-containing protein [Cystobacterineae bacterium]